jgi:hypothetical protein
LAGADHLLVAKAVAVQDFAREQPRDRLESDVRVWANTEASAIPDQGRADVIRETPRPDRPALTPWERPANSLAVDASLTAGRDLKNGFRGRDATLGISGSIFGSDRATHP